MSGGDRQRVLKAAADLGWTDAGDNKKGYTKLKCPCGNHITWLHKTPSKPKYARS